VIPRYQQIHTHQMNYQETSTMSDDKVIQQSHTTVDNDEEEASVPGSISSARKKTNAFGKKNNKHRSENTIQELAGHLFTFGNQGQQSNYLKTKRAVADFFGMTSDFGKEIFRAIKEGKEPEFQEPEEPPSKATQAQLRKYEILFKRYLDNEEKYKREKTKVFRVIMWQCTPTLRNKLESLPKFSNLEEKDDFVGLLKRIKDLVYSTDNTQYEYWRLQASFVKLANLKQEQKESINGYAKRFLAQVEATESLWGPLVPTAAIKRDEVQFDEEDDKETRKKIMEDQAQLDEEERSKARGKFLACLFLAGSDRERYKTVVDDLGNDFTLGKANYPEDVAGMLHLLTNRIYRGQQV
jgi:hypothetical protein